MDAAAQRPVAHFFLEAKRASEELERGGHVAIEEIRDDLRRPGGGRHGDLVVRYAQPACALLLPLGEGYAHFSFVVQLTSKVSVKAKSCAVLPGASATLHVPLPVIALYLPVPPRSAMSPLSGPS